MRSRIPTVYVAALVMLASGVRASPPPITAFATPAQIRDATISLDGRHIAYIANVQGRSVALVLDLSTPGKITPVLKSDMGSNIDLRWCRWGNDTRLVCGIGGAVASNVSGKALMTTKMVAVDADGGNLKVLMDNGAVDDAQYRDVVIDWTPSDPRTVLVQAVENQRTTGTYLTTTLDTPTVFKLDIYTSGLTKIMKARANIDAYATDGNGELRLASGTFDTTRIYAGRLVGDDEWRMLAKVNVFDKENRLSIARAIPGANKAYAVGGNNGRQALWEIDLEDKHPPLLIFEHPQVDLGYFEYERATGKLLGYQFDTDRPFFQYEDARLGSVMQGINKALSTTFNSAVSFTDDFKKFIILSASDVNGGSYYYFDAAARKLSELGRAYPELQAATLGRMRSIEYPARDGAKIPGYLTVPPDVRAENLPLIVMPHDGPAGRDTWKFDYLEQFLVSRGYAVLKMNFRGSSGYGSEWLLSAHQDWGGLSYSDIHDGTRWAISQGIADPKRVCILGRGFGGYAALLGAVRNSDVYRCAASIGGVTDLSEILVDRWNHQDADVIKERVGSNREKLKSDSPAMHAKDVAIPVLLIHGTLDVTTPIEHGRKMARALKSEKKQYKFVEIKDADRSLWRRSERETMLLEVEEFLKAHLGPGATPQS
jgi:dipeptidyl aminopeptidase/acylaminoacyl peptidase